MAPLDGQELSGSVSVRATVSGPMTSARMLVGGAEVASGTPVGNAVTLRADGVDVSALSGEQVVRVEASGRNPDPRADDDVAASAPFVVVSGGEDTHEAVAGQWISDSLGWWWRNADGTYPASTSMRIGGELYRFDARGYMVTGWVSEGGRWYYHGVSGAQASGWVSVGGTWYYLDPVSGAMASGWVNLEGAWYYLDASGAMRTGWLRDGSAWYYLRASGAMATGWVLDGGSWYYLDASGAMVTGSRVIDGVSYVFDPSGRML